MCSLCRACRRVFPQPDRELCRQGAARPQARSRLSVLPLRRGGKSQHFSACAEPCACGPHGSALSFDYKDLAYGKTRSISPASFRNSLACRSSSTTSVQSTISEQLLRNNGSIINQCAYAILFKRQLF